MGDILISSILIILTSPIILIAAILIKIEDGGPIFYSQKRNTMNMDIFNIIKLRTMHVNAEKDGAKWFKYGDQRVTNIGKFLRLMRFDELPQLLEVFSGNMSLIGPRPERPSFDVDLKKQIKFYELRYLIKPGLSGWAQVNYPYGSSVEDSKKKLSYDLYYLKNFSIYLDFLILFKTIKLVLSAKGAIPLKR